MELLQEALPSLKIKEAAYTRVEALAPWGLDFIPYHHTKFGIVSEGVCHIDLKNGEPPVRLARGSCYLLTRGDAFRLRDAALSHATPFEHLLQHLQGRLLRWGGDGDKTTIIGGRFIFASNRYPHLLDLLPPLIHFTVSEQELRGLVSTIELLGNETSHPSSGSNIMVDRLADLFFIQSLRAYWRSDAQQQVGWIGAVADEKLSRALGAMHKQPGHPWTLETLAAQAGMSRAVFAARFKTKLGIAPIAYLTRHRLQQAQQLLQHPSQSIAQISAQVGYSSEAAFNKAFRRQFGVPPGAFRQQLTASNPTPQGR